MGKKPSETTGPRKVKVLLAFHRKKTLDTLPTIAGYLWYFNNIYQIYWWSDSWTRMCFTTAINTISKKWVKTNTIVESKKHGTEHDISWNVSREIFFIVFMDLRAWKSLLSFNSLAHFLYGALMILDFFFFFIITDICYSVLYPVTRRVQAIKRRKWKW